MARRKRRRYTDEERATLVAMVFAEGYPDNNHALSHVAQYAKMPVRTLWGWVVGKNNPPPVELQEQKKQDLAALFKGLALKMLDHAGQEQVIEEMTGAQATTAAAIAVDKWRLLTDQSTDNQATAITLRVIYDGNDRN